MRRMTRSFLVLMAGLIAAPLAAKPALAQEPTPTILYNLTFTGETLNEPPPPHVPGAVAPRTRVSSVFDENSNDSVNVVEAHGVLTDTPLEFVAFGGTGSVPGVDRNWIILRTDDFDAGVVPTDGTFVAQGELTIDAGAGANSFVAIWMNDPTNNPGSRVNLLFDGDTGFVSATLGGATPEPEEIRPFEFGTRITFRIEVEVSTNTYRIFVDGSLLGSGVFSGETIGNVQITVGKSAVESTIVAAVDNVLVSVSPATPPPPGPTAGVLYDVDFDAEPLGVLTNIHEQGAPAPRNAVSAVFGNPTVIDDRVALTSRVAELDSFDETGDQIALLMTDFPGGLPPDAFFVVESDLSIAAISAGLNVRINFNANTLAGTSLIQAIDFESDGTVRAVVIEAGPGDAPEPVIIGTFTFGSLINLRVDVDLAADTWTILLNGVVAHSGSFGGATEITAIRFANSTAIGASFAIDNILVSLGPSPFPESTLTGDALASACTTSTTTSGGTPPYIVGVTIGKTDLGPIAGKGPEIATCEDTFPDTAPRLEVCSRSPTGPNPCFDPATLPDVSRTHREKVAVVRRSPDSTVHCFEIEGFFVCVDFSSPTSP